MVTVTLESVAPLHGGHFKNPANYISVALHTGIGYRLVGPNGAGKTFLLNCIAGLVPPAHGHIRCYYGMTDMPPIEFVRQGHLSYVLQTSPAPDSLRVREYCRLAAIDRGSTLLKCGLDERHFHGGTLISKFSLGERQFFGSAVALLRTARLYLLDEPFRHLDTRRVALLWCAIKERLDAGATVVVVSHGDVGISTDEFHSLIGQTLVVGGNR